MENSIIVIPEDGIQKKVFKKHKLVIKRKMNTHSHITFLSSESLIGNVIT